MMTLVEVVLAFVVTSALLLALVHLLLPAKRKS
jgi:Tfp pilus assembly protein PilV